MRAEIPSIAQNLKSNPGIQNLVFVCTHNSRRSHFAAVWAQFWAFRLQLDIKCFSAGTEKTRVFPAVVQSLQNSGLDIVHGGEEYIWNFGSNSIPLFSKTLTHSSLPEKYHVITTCADAEENCPFIPEAISRSHLPYTDPKWSDGTLSEKDSYQKKCMEINSDMRDLMSEFKSLL